MLSQASCKPCGKLPQAGSGKGKMNILDYIPIGSDKGITRQELCRITGMADRVVREEIHKARRKIPIINLSDGQGYFIPDMNTETDKALLKCFVKQEESRLKSIGWSLKTARKTLRNVGYE